MRTRAACILLFIQLFEAHAELILRHLSESQSLQLSCSPQQDHGLLTALHLYRRNSSSQTTLLSLSEGGELRVDPVLRGRLRFSGGLDSLQFNVSISHLQPADTGLYLWEQSFRKNSSEQVIMGAQKVFLFVDGTGRSCQCSSSYHPLLLTIFAAAGLFLMTMSCLAMLKCVKATHCQQPQPSAPIYEEMTRKQQNVDTPQNNPPSHLEEVNFPVYANPNIRRQLQENYYACPRQFRT